MILPIDPSAAEARPGNKAFVPDNLPDPSSNAASNLASDPTLDSASDLPSPRTAVPRPSPDDAARDNARRGAWRMNEDIDGWVLIGANGRPVMRRDGSRVAFRLYDAERLAADYDDRDRRTGQPAPSPPVTLADLDSDIDDDWQPQRLQSYFADLTKSAKLLAYHYVRFTTPEEAVRRAVADLTGNPVHIDDETTKAWIPKKYDPRAVRLVAKAMRQEAIGPEREETGEPVRESSHEAHNEGRASGREDPLNGEGDSKTAVGSAHPNEIQDDALPSDNEHSSARDNPLSLAGRTEATDSNPTADVPEDPSQRLAEFGTTALEQTKTILTGEFDTEKLLGPAKLLREYGDEHPLVLGIGALRGRAPRLPARTMRRIWEKAKGRKWPKDPKTGENMIASHKKALADRGTNSARNIKPLTRKKHLELHMEAGDFSRWAQRRWRKGRGKGRNQ